MEAPRMCWDAHIATRMRRACDAHIFYCFRLFWRLRPFGPLWASRKLYVRLTRNHKMPWDLKERNLLKSGTYFVRRNANMRVACASQLMHVSTQWRASIAMFSSDRSVSSNKAAFNGFEISRIIIPVTSWWGIPDQGPLFQLHLKARLCCQNWICWVRT